METAARFGLEYNPFLKNAKEILVDTKESREAAFRLDYLAKNKGFGILTGSAGRGKTTAVRRWKASLNQCHLVKASVEVAPLRTEILEFLSLSIFLPLSFIILDLSNTKRQIAICQKKRYTFIEVKLLGTENLPRTLV